MNNTIKSTGLLMLSAMIWGFAFVAQRSGMEHVGPFFFNGTRTALGALSLVAFMLIRGGAKRGPRAAAAGTEDARATAGGPAAFRSEDGKSLLQGGLLCGLVLFAGSNFQQIGLVFTTASKAGFITALYIILVPIFGIFLRHKIHWNTWAGVLLAAVGLYCLCLTESFRIAPGDLIVLFGAAFWAMHILVIDHFVRRVDAIRLSCAQFAVCSALSFAVMPFADARFMTASALSLKNVLAALPAILYTGVLSSGAGFTLQAIGQKYANPTAASVIMSTEAIFGVIGGFLLLGERFTGREMLGCVLMFAAVILAQLPLGARGARS
ncbi:MAG: DMT family transporter [Clostridiales Family XIII bacterium]|jgi:drug/metabolite transporter (DMT)-like permease|nr:DMT family transporter [Clostridiales Family XIII bacterium]